MYSSEEQPIDTEAIAGQIPDLEHKIEKIQSDLRLVTHHIHEMNLDLARENTEYLAEEQRLLTELQLLKVMNGEELKPLDQQAFDREDKADAASDRAKASGTSSEALPPEKRERLSKELFRKISGKVHPDKSDPRFAGMFEMACSLRRRKDVAKLRELWDTVQNMSKSGSYLLSRLVELRASLKILEEEYQELENSMAGNMLRFWKTGRKDAVATMYRRMRQDRIQELKSQIESLKRYGA